MDRAEELKALAWEARRLGTTYGKLAAGLEPGEIREICDRYRMELERRGKRKSGRDGSGPVIIVQKAKRPRKKADEKSEGGEKRVFLW